MCPKCGWQFPKSLTKPFNPDLNKGENVEETNLGTSDDLRNVVKQPESISKSLENNEISQQNAETLGKNPETLNLGIYSDRTGSSVLFQQGNIF